MEKLIIAAATQSLTRFGLDDLDLHPSFRFTNVGHLSIRKRLGGRLS
jgi:hypothetical protein